MQPPGPHMRPAEPSGPRPAHRPAWLARTAERERGERVNPSLATEPRAVPLLADENIPGDAVAALRAAGHDVEWIRTECLGASMTARGFTMSGESLL
jgi:hypothetical protein